jgi:hypothetical protein
MCENKKVHNPRTPKGHHSDDQIIWSDDDDEDEFGIVTHQRKRFQLGDKDKDDQEQIDVMCKKDGMN